MRIKIVGLGIVGKNMLKIFPDAIKVDTNPELGISADKAEYADVAFICVPTPMMEDGQCDTSFVRKAIEENSAHVFCIKSTIPPGTSQNIHAFTQKRIVFSPEYFGETIHANNVDYNFVILGGKRNDTTIVAEAYKLNSHSNLKIMQTDYKTAELCKYMENAYLGMMVTFCNEFYRIAEYNGIDYNELRELFLLDPRVNRSHTFVYKDQPYYKSKCLDKDIPAIIKFAELRGYEPKFIKQIVASNEIFKENKP